MRKKRVVLFALIGLLVFLAALAFAGNYFYTYSLIPRRGERAPGVPDAEYSSAAEAWPGQGAYEWLDASAHDVWIESADGLRLRGQRVDADTGRYAILAHGYSANGRSMAAFGERFHAMGFTVLIPDLRGHGESEGHYIGMGWHDRLDMLRWIDAIVREDPGAKILLFGISMGGATVMMTAGEALPPNVKAIVEDCGYTSVWDEFSGQMKEQFGLPPFPLMQAASAVTKLRAGFWLSEADAVKQVARSKTPILFIHGEEDAFVPFWMLEVLYEAAGCEKEKLAVPGAGHGMASSIDPDTYWSTVEAFIGRYLVP
ncbi:MAG: alpha/beta hydrolase [Clostridia bacterium]|nr:alpha/beta hydrolase [Clostridia bacterium]